MKHAILLFLLCAVPVTALDIYTTEIGRTRGGFIELHPAGFLTWKENIYDDSMKIFIGMLIVGIAAFFKRDALKEAAKRNFYDFDDYLFSPHTWAVFMIVLPCFFALTRWAAVITNACNLTIGWSPIQRVFLDPFEYLTGNTAIAHMIEITIIMVILWFPLSRIIMRALYFMNGGRGFSKASK